VIALYMRVPTMSDKLDTTRNGSEAMPAAPYQAMTRHHHTPLLQIICAGIAVAALSGCEGVSRVSGVPVHFTSHQLCSAVFVGGLDPTAFYEEAIAPKLGAVGRLIHYEVDRERREIRVSLAGLVRSRAVDKGPFGCRVIHPGTGFAVTPDDKTDTQFAATLFGPGGGDPVAPEDAALSDAIDSAFIEPESPPHRYTKAVVVVHRGQIVGERYAPGVTTATPLTGWSMTKSVTNALLGILVRDGKLDMNKPAPIAEWASPVDPHHEITSDQLLRMVSGLHCGQSLVFGWRTAFDTDTHMEYDMPDQAAFAAHARLQAKPGSEWQYTNCNFVLLSQIIRDAAGGDPEAVRQFIARELFHPLGLEHATLEFDSSGTPLGTIHLWASARDWARFGLLYLHDGVSVSGQRILPEGWVDYSVRLTPQSDAYGYGAGFWTQRGNSSAARERIVAGFPADSFMALGSQGQYTIIIPSEDLVIVRIGWSYTPHDDLDAVGRLTREVIAALHSSKRSALKSPAST
jgi:CubicO group peptidase (beta-lactamase class C family)